MTQLKGVKVLELASVLAGPSVGQFFAELGADVIKVENLKTGGDVTRSWKIAGETTDDRSAYFCSVNWGKRSIAIDLTTLEGKSIVQKLSEKSDIIIASYKPGDAEKLGVDYQTVSKRNPTLIYGQITGYGSHNPRVGYDAIIQAEAGFISINGEPGGDSFKMPVALMDILAGHHMKEGLLLAMLERLTTGKGKLVEVSLIQAAVSSLANQATNWLVGNKLPKKQGSAHPNIAPYGDVFKTADGKEVLLAIGSDQQFFSLCNILKIASSDTSKYKTNADRVENRTSLVRLLNERICQLQSQEFLKALHEANVPAGIIQNIKEAFEMDEAKEILIQHGNLKGIRNKVFDQKANLPSHFLPPPHFGEHTTDILTKFLSYEPERVNMLYQTHIIQ